MNEDNMNPGDDMGKGMEKEGTDTMPSSDEDTDTPSSDGEDMEKGEESMDDNKKM